MPMKWTKQRLNNMFFFLGCAAVVVMLLTFDVSFIELWEHLCHAGYWLVPILGVWLLVYGLNALAWKAIIEGNLGMKAPISFWRIYRLTITGYALNYATPLEDWVVNPIASWNYRKTSTRNMPLQVSSYMP